MTAVAAVSTATDEALDADTSDDVAGRRGPSGVGLGITIVVWAAVALVCAGLVLYLLEPMFQARIQADLLDQYQTTLLHAANEANTLAGATAPTKPIAFGQPVGVLEIGTLHLRQVVLEGVSARSTQRGPGHVPGTSGLGQPGNSVVVGRHQLFGGTFGKLSQLRPHDKMLVTTTQGQSVYEVSSVATITLSGSGSHSIAALYGHSSKGRLTLVTGASSDPLSSNKVTVVVSDLLGRPFAPTPQHHFASSQTGRAGDSGGWLVLGLAVAAFAAAAVFAVYLYRRMSPRVAYLLSTPMLIVVAVLLAESLSRLLPAWA
jgi:sortase A